MISGPPPVTPATERFQFAIHLLLCAMGYNPLRTWAAGEFLFVAFTSTEKAQAALSTFRHVRWVLEVELKREEDGSPYLVVRH